MPFGFGVPAQGVTRERTDGARFIDPATGDYETDGQGVMRRMPAVRQQVLVAMRTVVTDLTPVDGLQRPRRIDAQYQREADDSVRRALAHLVRNRVLTVEEVRVDDTRGGRAKHTIVYRDLATGETDEVTT